MFFEGLGWSGRHLICMSRRRLFLLTRKGPGMKQRIKVGFFGFGKTGQDVVRDFFKEEMFEVCWVVRKTNKDHHKFASRLLGIESDQGRIFAIQDLTRDFFSQHFVDLIVDFSAAEGLMEYASAADHGIKIVSAVSHYGEEQRKILQEIRHKTAVLYSPNITLGINFLMVASQLLSRIAPHADIEIVEEHFRDKKNVSGTALRIADALRLDSQKHINSIRVGGIVGRHEVIFGFPNQTVRLIHESSNRRAFAQGAIFAGKWLVSQPMGLYSMEHIVSDMMRQNLPVY